MSSLDALKGELKRSQQSTVIAMLVLVGEVYYYKRKTKREKEMESPQTNIFTTKIQPFEYPSKAGKNSVLLGSGHFVPVDKTKRRLSIISIQARD